ncbi:hypothetical protein FH972_016717 [Carpinus fangiana]|uniref:Uncharacterized protein n=1 Tax=Carpinus fangiana TaxID=176857 RepID=A0A5N6RI07_9ROSI|nr:hypothetical protein FH972_016717 [Carpinus fangiana]
MEPDQHIVSIDEHYSRKVIRIEDRPTITREERFRRLTGAGVQRRAEEPAKIQKVIFLLRDHKHFVKYFEPRVAAVGPIHHGNPKYRLGEEYKLTSKFVELCGKDINCLYEEAEMEIKQLRGCFEEEVTKNYDDEALAWMLFVDGCAILQYISCVANDNFKELNIKNDSVAFAHQDLFLLENQVPYRLLKLLMKYSGKEEQLSESIERFIGIVTNQQMKLQQKQGERDQTHLLDLLRTRLLGPFGKNGGDQDRDSQSYRNVQELKSVGIQLKRSKNNSHLREISFTRNFGFYPGYLWLPPITVDDSTGPKFMNMIAYEMCLDFENDFGISSYISFLDSLIDEANDVKDMRKAQVLRNFLGSDQQVADLFNEIGTDVVPNSDAYKDVKRQIQKYYDIPCMTWMAQVYHNHFSSPWTFLAFLGVLLGLGLTAAQTAYAVKASHPGPCEKFCMLKLKET